MTDNEWEIIKKFIEEEVREWFDEDRTTERDTTNTKLKELKLLLKS